MIMAIGTKLLDDKTLRVYVVERVLVAPEKLKTIKGYRLQGKRSAILRGDILYAMMSSEGGILISGNQLVAEGVSFDGDEGQVRWTILGWS